MRARGEGSAAEVLRASLVLGLTSFGGPVAHLAYFRREYVERRRWLDDTAYADLVALCQALPGPASSQLGIAIGAGRAGVAGAIAAWVGFTLPSAVALIALGVAAATTLDLTGAGWVAGLKLAAVAVVAHAVLGMALTLTADVPRRAIALGAAVVALVVGGPFSQVAIIAAGAVAGWLLLPAADAVPPVPSPVARQAGPPRPRVPARLGVASGALFVALLVVLPLLALAAPGDGSLALVDAFYRAGSLVFGGGHVVLPLLEANTVAPGWVTEDAFLAGYGAAQAVPGPLFTFAGYLGAVASAGPGGAVGGLLALVAIFLPSFLLVFGALPFWDRLRARAPFRRALAGVGAVVVGLLAAALYDPVATSAVRGPLELLLAAIGLAALASARIPVVAVVAAFAVAGELLTRLT